MLNRSENGVSLKLAHTVCPETTFNLIAYSRLRKNWELLQGKTKWIETATKNQMFHQIGAEVQHDEMNYKLFEQKNRVKHEQPLASDYQFFRRTELLKSITRDAVCPILNSVAFKFVRAGQRFIRQGEPGNAFYVIQKGICVVHVEKDGEFSAVARLRDGDIVGEMAILTGEPRSAHVDAETDMHLWQLTKAQFERISEIYPDLRNFLTDLLTRWIDKRPVTAKRKIAKYTITDILGKGGYSIVYRGVHEVLNMPVAIKMLKHDMAMETAFIKSFRNEAKTIANFNHENIVKVYDIEERYQTVFIIMEHLEGMPLRKVLQEIIKLTPKQVVNYLIQICSGLAYAHEQGVVHQDIKPGNIFIQPDDKVKILDFGLACPCGSESFFTGTPFYMSPEQIECIPVDERTDIYGLGITAYEMLTGQRPYPEKDAWAVMDMHVNIDIPNPASLVPEIPDGLGNFIMKACARSQDQRYQNITEVISDLKSLADKIGLIRSAVSSPNQKVLKLLLHYRDENRNILNREMEKFISKMQKIGVACKTIDFEEI